MKKAWLVLLILCLTVCPAVAEEEEEVDFLTLVGAPSVTLLSPGVNQTYPASYEISVRAKGDHVDKITAECVWEGGRMDYEQVGKTLEYTFALPKLTCGATITVRGHGKDAKGYDVADERSVYILSPKERLIIDMFAEAKSESTNKKYRYAPAQEDWDLAVCKNFVMRLFDTFSKSYRMAEFPDLALHMPKNNSKVNCAPYDYGIEWRIEGAADGSPFEIAEQFKYDQSLSKEENRALCRKVLESVQKGDFFQMVGDYYHGNGPHSLLFMADYSAAGDMMTWTDSNMLGDRVDGVRWGYIQYEAQKTAEWFVDAICTKNRGCTLYRLRDDLYIYQ